MFLWIKICRLIYKQSLDQRERYLNGGTTRSWTWSRYLVGPDDVTRDAVTTVPVQGNRFNFECGFPLLIRGLLRSSPPSTRLYVTPQGSSDTQPVTTLITVRLTMMEPGTPGFGGGSSYPPPLQPLEVHITKWQRKYQQTLDRLTPHVYQRWAATAGLVTLFMLRIVFSQGVSGFLEQLLSREEH